MMKDFFEDLGKRLGETAETMTNMAGDAIEIQRMKSQIRTLARGSAVDLMELGKTIYDRYKEGAEVGEKEKSLCEAVQDRENSIKDYEKKIAKLKGSSECASCGKMVSKDMSFCPYCGEKIASAVKDAGDEMEDAVAEMKDKAEKAAERVEEMAEKAAEKVSQATEKAVEKAGDFADKAADRLHDAADRMNRGQS